jgi:hypothetical protein
MKEVKNLKKTPLLVVGLLLLAMTVCVGSPVVATGEAWIDVDDTANEILNDTEQEDLIELVVFAFTIGIIMTILGFAMGIMYRKR